MHLRVSAVAFVPFGLKQSLKVLLLFLLAVIVAIGGALVNFCNPDHPSDTNRSCKTNTVNAACGTAWTPVLVGQRERDPG